TTCEGEPHSRASKSMASASLNGLAYSRATNKSMGGTFVQYPTESLAPLNTERRVVLERLDHQGPFR
ncbi:MAG: hypothetical protein ACI80K_004767, partial [Paracoccaceae bacterium]